MAIRNPTAFTKYFDYSDIRAGKTILASTWDEIINDQSFMLHHENIIISDCFFRWRCSSGTYETIAVYHLDTIDKCSVAALGSPSNCEWAVYCRCSSGSTGTIRLETTGGADTATVAITNTSWDWIGTNATTTNQIDAVNSTAEETFTLSAKLDSGSYIWIGGLWVTSDET